MNVSTDGLSEQTIGTSLVKHTFRDEIKQDDLDINHHSTAGLHCIAEPESHLIIKARRILHFGPVFIISPFQR